MYEYVLRESVALADLRYGHLHLLLKCLFDLLYRARVPFAGDVLKLMRIQIYFIWMRAGHFSHSVSKQFRQKCCRGRVLLFGG